MKKSFIINDPIYGFIEIPNGIIRKIIDHPYFQRLRRIKQLGLTNLVFPGAVHTRFEHSIGAMHLMQKAVKVLQSKGIDITKTEAEAVCLAILLHDIGHGPFSHASEKSIAKNTSHEKLTVIYMQHLNKEFKGALDLTIQIFTNQYHKKFLYQLVSSQLDMDRLDYLKRDSFFTGVVEGIVNIDRIIIMLDVEDDMLVFDYKAIYPIEHFLISRRLMYWEVYFHKTVVAAEFLLIKIFERAREILHNGAKIGGSEMLQYFLSQDVNSDEFNNTETLEKFSELDDYDIFSSIKQWAKCDDVVLAVLSKTIINRNLHKIEISNTKISRGLVAEQKVKTRKRFNILPTELDYLTFTDTISNHAYNKDMESINIRMKNGNITEIINASDQLNIKALSAPVTKYFICYPR